MTISNVTLNIPNGSLSGTKLKTSAEILPAQMQQQTYQLFGVALSSMKSWDAMQTNLPGTPASDDLGLLTGTAGTDAPTIESGDLKAAGSTNRKAAFEFTLPPNYEAAETVEIRATAGMETTVADTAATIDFEVYKIDGTGGVGSDLCATSATSINSLTASDKDFTITATGLSPGDHLHVVMTVNVNDGATGTAVVAAVYKVQFRVDTRG